jgi:hypothetical protein
MSKSSKLARSIRRRDAKTKEDLIDRRNKYGVDDPTPYLAVKRIADKQGKG